MSEIRDELAQPQYHPPTPGSVWCKYDNSWVQSKSDIGVWFHRHACVHCKKEVSWGGDTNSEDSLQVWSHCGWTPARIHRKCLDYLHSVDDYVFVDRDGTLKNIESYYEGR